MASAVGAAAVAVFLGVLVMNSVISHQNGRNQVLQEEMKLLDKKIDEIKDLEAKKDRLVARNPSDPGPERGRALAAVRYTEGIVIIAENASETLRKVSEIYDDPLLVFIDTPDRDEQRRRLIGRGDPDEKVQARLERGDHERELAQTTSYVTVINDDLEDAVQRVHDLILAARAK